MRETLEKLWEDYLLEECDSVKTSEERKMMKNAVVVFTVYYIFVK